MFYFLARAALQEGYSVASIYSPKTEALYRARERNPVHPPVGGGGGSRISEASCYVWKYLFLDVLKIYVKVFSVEY